MVKPFLNLLQGIKGKTVKEKKGYPFEVTLRFYYKN